MSETQTRESAHGCMECEEEVETIVDIVQHDCYPVHLDPTRLSRKERNTLLYVEHRIVDFGGKLDPAQMNHVDHQNLKLFEAAGLLEVSDAMRDPDNPRADTFLVEKFTDAAWDIVRDCRKMRALGDDRVDFPVGHPPQGIFTLPAEGVCGDCFQCGIDIHYGEWHVALDSDSSFVPRDTLTRAMTGDGDGRRRLCGSCSGRDERDFPDDEPIAGM